VNSWLPMQHTYPSTMITPILRRSFPMRARIDKVRIHPISSTHTQCDYSAHFHAVQPVRRQSLIHSPPSTRFGPTRPSKYSHSSGRPTTSPFLASLHIARGHYISLEDTTYRSRTLGQASTSPFSIWCKVNGGKVTYMHFMEDTLGTTDPFKKDGKKQYVVFEEKGEIEV